MSTIRWTRSFAAIAAAGTVLAAASPIALAEPRGLHLGHPAAVSRGLHESITLTDVEANAAAVNALYQQYKSLVQASGSSTQPAAVQKLISELQSDLTALQNATSSESARQTMNQILKQVAQAEAALRNTHALAALEQQISKEYSQFTQELNQVTSESNVPTGQLRQLWNLENLLMEKLREAIRALGATPTTTQTSTGSSTSSTSSNSTSSGATTTSNSTSNTSGEANTTSTT